MKKIGLILLTLVSCISFSLSAATLTVCASGCDHTTIQAAINAASSGDVIDILDAVHTEDDILVDKNLTIQGQGQNATIVQAAATRAAADDGVFMVNPGLTVLFQDLTIRHGNARTGGSSPAFLGGGVNIFCSSSTDISFERVSISNNETEGDGGGVYIDGDKGKVHFIDCVISDNESDNFGGGINNRGADDFKLIRCTISGNTAEAFAGGVSAEEPGSVAQWINCTIYNNTVGGDRISAVGGGVFLDGRGSSFEFINCTIVDNKLISSLQRSGGGIARGFGTFGMLTLTNTIVANNTGAAFPTSGDDIYDESGGAMTITTSLVEDCDGCSATPTYTSDPNLAAVATCGEQSYFEPLSGSDALGNGTPPGGDIPTDDICGNVRCQYNLGSYEMPVDPMPQGYSSSDIGDVSGQVGNTVNGAPGAYTVTTAGKGIKGTADGFHFDSFDPVGDVDLIVRVTGIQNNSSRQAGLMLREHLGPGAPHVALIINGQKGIKLIRRANENGPTLTVATRSANRRLNSWLRLTRTGNNVIAYYSRQGTVWEYVGSTTFDYPCRYEAGLATSKGAGGGKKVFSYDNFSLNGVVPTPPPPRLTAPQMVDLTLTAYPNPFMDQLSYRLEGVAGGDATVRLLDMTGRVIATVEPLESNGSTVAINTSEIAAGIYFLEAKTATERKLVKVIKK